MRGRYSDCAEAESRSSTIFRAFFPSTSLLLTARTCLAPSRRRVQRVAHRVVLRGRALQAQRLEQVVHVALSRSRRSRKHRCARQVVGFFSLAPQRARNLCEPSQPCRAVKNEMLRLWLAFGGRSCVVLHAFHGAVTGRHPDVGAPAALRTSSQGPRGHTPPFTHRIEKQKHWPALSHSHHHTHIACG